MDCWRTIRLDWISRCTRERISGWRFDKVLPVRGKLRMAIVLCTVGRCLIGDSWGLGWVGVEVVQHVFECDKA